MDAKLDMVQARLRPANPRAFPCLAVPRWSDQLWALVYRSHPRQELSASALQQLLHEARAHNLDAGISGVLVFGEYEGQSEIVQWLEGPEMAVRELMAKIVTDERHADIAVLDSFPIKNRMFGHWAMLFANEDTRTSLDIAEEIQGRTHAIADLEAGVTATRKVFQKIAQIARRATLLAEVRTDAETNLLTQIDVHKTEQLIDTLLTHSCLPAVAEHLGSNGGERSLLISALTRLALNHDVLNLETVLRRSSNGARDPLAAQILMLEQTERRLGDLWESESCSEMDITLAQLEMVSAIRAIHLGARPLVSRSGTPPAVLVISEPGEFHMLPAVLDAEVLFQRGWQPQLEFPASDRDLAQRLGGEWFEAVDISLSDVFRREHWLERLAATVAAVRKHSLNRHIAITVSGRMFRDQHELLLQTGADRLVLSASEIEWSLSEAMRAHGVTMPKVGPGLSALN